MIENHELKLIGLIMKKPELIDHCNLIRNFENPFSTQGLNQVFEDCVKLYGETGAIERKALLLAGREKGIESELYMSLVKNAGFAENLHEYVQSVYSTFVKRRLSGLGQLIINCYQDDLQDHSEYFKAVRKELEYIESNSAVTVGVTMKEAVGEVMDKVAKICEGDNTTYFATGILCLDRIIKGFTRKTMSLIGARPSVGKSALGLTMISNMAQRGLQCGYISVEMSEAECVERIMQVRSGMSVDDFAQEMPINKMKQFMNSGDQLSKCNNLKIVRTTNRKISNIRAIARQMKNAMPDLSVIFIDYIQKIEGDGKFESKRVEINSVSETLTDMATDLDVHICNMAQINRSGDDMPRMKDLKESGQLEQDAHYVILIHRDLNQQFDGEFINDCQLIVSKNRGGRTGIASSKYNCKTTRFFDDTTEDFEPWTN